MKKEAEESGERAKNTRKTLFIFFLTDPPPRGGGENETGKAKKRLSQKGCGVNNRLKNNVSTGKKNSLSLLSLSTARPGAPFSLSLSCPQRSFFNEIEIAVSLWLLCL